ncbi:hypothetical protein FKM82_010573 [Ascaphus truei]
MDFMKETFSELIRRMGSTTAKQIVDDLFAQNILSMEEMNVILAEKVNQDVSRKLVLLILNKGEESCTHFVQLLQKLDQYLFQHLLGENVMVKEKEEDFNSLADDLKHLYLSPVFQKFHPLGEKMDIDILFDLETTFTDPLLWKKDTRNRREKQLTIDELLRELKSPCIIEGEAGKGKTTILKRIAVLWASGNCTALHCYKLVFFVSLSSASEGLYETLCDQLFGVSYKWNKKVFIQELWSLKNEVLFLLDGYDEFQYESCMEIETLIKENHKFKSMVIVSTRTETIGKVRKFGSLIAETSDFTEESAKQLIGNVLEEEEAKGLLSQLEQSIFMKSLMKTPLFVVIACALRMGESNIQMNTQTALFCTLYDLMVAKSESKTTPTSSNLVTESISHCEVLALDGLFNHRFDFRQEDLSSIKEEVLLSAGLLHKYTAQRHRALYRFFHKSYQEYIAARRFAQLLSSEKDLDGIKGEHYLSKIDSVYDITTKYSNLLLYTCGSSKAATQKVVKHITRIYKKDINNNSTEFAEFGVSLFYESSTKSDLSKEFEALFSDKSMYINPHNISSHHFEFFQHLPNCLSALHLIKLDLFGTSFHPSSENVTDRNSANAQSNECKTYISEKVVLLFFDSNQALQTLEVTLKDFNKLNKLDIKYLGKICCSANRLRLNIKRSAGITGTLTDVLESCRNMQDLIVDSTRLSIEDERRIVDMTVMKTLCILDMQTEHQAGGLLDGLCNLVNIEKLVFHGIKMNENDAQTLANGISNLKRLKILNLSHMSNIGKGMDQIAESISLNCYELEDLKLAHCCLTGIALKTISRNLNSFPKIKMLDFSENVLEEDGKQSVEELVQGLSLLPELTSLLLPGGSNVKLCLDGLLIQLKQMPKLSKLGFKRWSLTDADMVKLATLLKENFEHLTFLDLSDNCATSDGWLSLTEALKNLKNLTYFNFSTEHNFKPYPGLVLELSSVISNQNLLPTIVLDNWQLDKFDLLSINNAKEKIHR